MESVGGIKEGGVGVSVTRIARDEKCLVLIACRMRHDWMGGDGAGDGEGDGLPESRLGRRQEAGLEAHV